MPLTSEKLFILLDWCLFLVSSAACLLCQLAVAHSVLDMTFKASAPAQYQTWGYNLLLTVWGTFCPLVHNITLWITSWILPTATLLLVTTTTTTKGNDILVCNVLETRNLPQWDGWDWKNVKALEQCSQILTQHKSVQSNYWAICVYIPSISASKSKGYWKSFGFKDNSFSSQNIV